MRSSTRGQSLRSLLMFIEFAHPAPFFPFNLPDTLNRATVGVTYGPKGFTSVPAPDNVFDLFLGPSTVGLVVGIQATSTPNWIR